MKTKYIRNSSNKQKKKNKGKIFFSCFHVKGNTRKIPTPKILNRKVIFEVINKNMVYAYYLHKLA